MKSGILIILMGFLCFPLLTFAQGSKTIKQHNIEKQTVLEYFIAEGLSKPVLEKEEVYDADGNVIELKELNKFGDVKLWQTYRYDKDGNKVEEATLDGKGKQVERIEWLYKENLVVEKKYYDDKNRLVKRKEYKYKYREN